jgi:uncharacterized membrane protein (DUF4010 family)
MTSVSELLRQLVAEVPADAWQILLILFLGFLVGLEREGHRAEAASMVFGGVRTFPIIGLFGYALAKLGGAELFLTGVGAVVVGLLMAVSFNNKLVVARASGGQAGATTETSALLIYLVGALVQHGELWIACTLVVACLLLLEMKSSLERLSARIPHDDVLTFTTFLVLTVVTLPVVPNHDFGPFKLNPFKTWLVVVAVTTISYASYVLQKLLKQSGVLLIAVLGGAYSSTLTTVTLAKKSAVGARPHLFSGGILMASGMMYLRLALLVSLFNAALMRVLAPSFVALGVAALGVGWLWARRSDPAAGGSVEHKDSRNPLELSAAFFFAVLFLVMLVITHLALTYLGKGGVFTLAAIMGVTDVDPFILGLTQSAGTSTPVALGAGAIAIAAASNNVIKGCYAFSFADRRTGTLALGFLLGLALLGLAPLIWI